MNRIREITKLIIPWIPLILAVLVSLQFNKKKEEIERLKREFNDRICAFEVSQFIKKEWSESCESMGGFWLVETLSGTQYRFSCLLNLKKK